MKNIFIIIAILIIILLLCCGNKQENFTECNNQSTPEDQIAAMGETAKDACNKISSEAENIKAHYGGINNIVKNMNPLNIFKSEDNEVDDRITNIMHNNLSTCDVTKIENACANSSSTLAQ